MLAVSFGTVARRVSALTGLLRINPGIAHDFDIASNPRVKFVKVKSARVSQPYSPVSAR